MVIQSEKPAAGSWTAAYPELGTAPISYEDSSSAEFYELEREAIVRRTWLNIGRVEQVPKNGSYFTKELAVCNTSIIVVRGQDDTIRAFHNICRHRGNKLVWTDFPREETSGTCGSSPASTTAGATTSKATAPSSSRSRSSSTSTSPTTAWCPCRSTCGRASSS